MKAYQILLVVMSALMLMLLVADMSSAGPVDPDSILNPAEGGKAVRAAYEPAEMKAVASTDLDDLAKPLDAVSISLDLAVARSVAKGNDPAPSNLSPARGGKAASPAKRLVGMR